MPAAHALVQAAEDIEHAVAPLSVRQLWITPGGAASVGFHARHVAGSIDRLLTYARGDQLDERQRAALPMEGSPGDPPAGARTLVDGAQRAIEGALEVIRGTPADALGEPRAVGRAGLPSTVLGLLFHVAEHTQRHTGQIVTTARIVRGLALALAAALVLGCSRGDDDRDVAWTPPATPPEHAEGERLFDAHCAQCHGRSAVGSATGPPLVHQIYEPGHHSDAAFYLAARTGVAAHHWRFGNMPAQPQVSEADMGRIIAYVRFLQRDAGIE